MGLEQHPKLQQIIENGYQFELGDYISQGIDIFKRNIGGFLGYTLLAGLIIIIAMIIPIVNFFAYFILVPVLYVGYYLVAHRLARGERAEFGEFFKGFDYTGQLALWFLMMIIAMVIVMIPAIISMFGSFIAIANTDPADYADNPFWIYSLIPWWVYLFYLPLIYMGVSWRWAPLFIIFNKMNFWDAIVASHRITNKQWWMQLVFCIILYIFANVGVILLIIGVLFTYPLTLCMDYAAFSNITKLQQEDNITDSLEEHLVE